MRLIQNLCSMERIRYSEIGDPINEVGRSAKARRRSVVRTDRRIRGLIRDFGCTHAHIPTESSRRLGAGSQVVAAPARVSAAAALSPMREHGRWEQAQGTGLPQRLPRRVAALASPWSPPGPTAPSHYTTSHYHPTLRGACSHSTHSSLPRRAACTSRAGCHPPGSTKSNGPPSAPSARVALAVAGRRRSVLATSSSGPPGRRSSAVVGRGLSV